MHFSSSHYLYDGYLGDGTNSLTEGWARLNASTDGAINAFLHLNALTVDLKHSLNAGAI
jgi:hypothetical protein